MPSSACTYSIACTSSRVGNRCVPYGPRHRRDEHRIARRIERRGLLRQRRLVVVASVPRSGCRRARSSSRRRGRSFRPAGGTPRDRSRIAAAPPACATHATRARAAHDQDDEQRGADASRTQALPPCRAHGSRMSASVIQRCGHEDRRARSPPAPERRRRGADAVEQVVREPGKIRELRVVAGDVG